MDKITSCNFVYGANIRVVRQSAQCTVYQLENDDGAGVMTSYQVFPGISLTYNDFHTSQCPHHARLPDELIEINHCREGRFECEFVNGMFTYLGEGDLAVNKLLSNRVALATFPLKHYHGVSVLIDIDAAGRHNTALLKEFSIDLYAVRDKLCDADRCFIIRATESIQHIFSELYLIPEAVKSGYFKIKVLELLLFLSALDVSGQGERRPYFPRNQVNSVKQIHQLLTQRMAEHFTLQELSGRFGLPLTSLNACFKAVYGKPVYAYIRSYRMQAAAAMLLQTNDSITTIAGNVGYENTSKFAGAFKALMQVSPSDYRKTH